MSLFGIVPPAWWCTSGIVQQASSPLPKRSFSVAHEISHLHCLLGHRTHTHFMLPQKSSCTLVCANQLSMPMGFLSCWPSRCLYKSAVFPDEDILPLGVFFHVWCWWATRSAFIALDPLILKHSAHLNAPPLDSRCMLHPVLTSGNGFLQVWLPLFTTSTVFLDGATADWWLHTSDLIAPHHSTGVSPKGWGVKGASAIFEYRTH